MLYEHSSLDIYQSAAKASFTISLLNTHRQPTANSTAKENIENHFALQESKYLAYFLQIPKKMCTFAA